MDFDTMLGVVVTLLAIAIIVVLYAWSARIIEHIRAKKLTSLRQIRKELKHGRRDA